MTIAPDSLVALVNTITTSHTQWTIVVDSETAPTIGDGSWTTGSVGGPFQITGNVPTGTEYDSHSYMLYINDGSTVTKILGTPTKVNSSGGIDLQARDTISPDWTGAAFSVSTNGSWSISPEPTDSGTGVDKYTIFDADTNLPILADVGTSGGAGSIVLLTGVTRAFFCRAYDAAVPANFADSNIVVVTPSAGASYGGLASIATPTAVDEGDPVQITVSLTGRTTDFGDVGFTISTLDRVNELANGEEYWGRYELDVAAPGDISRVNTTTANINITNIGKRVVAGDFIKVTTNGSYQSEYNGYFEVQTVTDDNNITYLFNSDPGVADDGTGSTVHVGAVLFPDNVDTDITFEVQTVAAAATGFNSVFEAYIDLGSITTNAEIDVSDIGKHAVLCEVDSTASGNGGYQAYTDGAYERIVLDTDMTWNFTVGDHGDSYNLDVAHDGAPVDDQATFAAAPDFLLNNPQNGTLDYYFTSSYDTIYTTLPASRASINIEIAVAGTYHIWLRGLHHSSAYTSLWVGIDGNATFGTQYFSFGPTASHPVDTWEWKEMYSTVTLSAGSHTFDIWCGQTPGGIYIGRVELNTGGAPVTNGTNDYDHSLSTQATAVAVDNPSNPTVAIGSASVDTITSGFTLSPANGNATAQTTVQPTFTLTSLVGIQLHSVTATINGGTLAITGTSNNIDTITFTLNNGNPISNSATVVITPDISAIDSDSVRKDVVTGTWSFDTIAAAPAGDVIFIADNSSLALTSAMTDAQYRSVYEDVYTPYIGGASALSVVADPYSGGTRPRVIKSSVPANALGTGNQSRIYHGATGPTAAYFYFDFFLPDVLPINKSIKLGGIFGYVDSTGPLPADGTGVVSDGTAESGFSARLAIIGYTNRDVANNAIPGGQASNAVGLALMCEAWQALGYWTYGNELSCHATPSTQALSSGAGPYVGCVPGRWNSIELFVDVGTAGNADGQCKIWVNGFLGLNWTSGIPFIGTGKSWTCNHTWFEIYHGGGDATFTSPEARSYYRDKITVSESRIGTVNRTTPWDGTN